VGGSPVNVEAVAPNESDAVLVAEGGMPEMEGPAVAAANTVMEGVGGAGEAEERAEGEMEGELDWDGDGVRLRPLVGLKDADSGSLPEGDVAGLGVGGSASHERSCTKPALPSAPLRFDLPVAR
jgi:hypothetical protein